VLGEYLRVRRALSGVEEGAEAGGAGEAPAGGGPSWQAVFRERKIRFLILYPIGLGRWPSLLPRLLGNPEGWPVCYLEGRTAIFGWDPHGPGGGGTPDRFAGLRVD